MAVPISDGDRGGERHELRLACSLEASDGAERLTRWRTLFEAWPPTVRRDPDQIVVRVPEAPGVAAELEALAAAERTCCAFVQWHVVHAADWHELQVQGTPEGLEAIAALFGGE
jgi:hypothetical protein